MAEIDYAEGSSVWQQLRVRDLDGIERFYQEVLGLRLEWEGGSGRLVTDEGELVAGVLVDPGFADEEVGWRVFLGVQDLDSVIARAVSLGCEPVSESAPLQRAGEHAVLRDPFGARFALARLERGEAVVPSGSLGRFAMVDPTNHDLEAQVAFQDALFPGGVHDEIVPHDVVFFRAADGTLLRGSYALPEETIGVIPPHWLPWFNVEDDARAAQSAEQAGGRVNTRDNHSRFGDWAVVVDPQGGEFKVLERDPDFA